jgi:hypothetical protein
MRVVVNFQAERLEFEVADERLMGVWHGPPGMDRTAVRRAVFEALETPGDFPPLRQAVVPGDRVTIALDAKVPDAVAILGAVAEVLARAGVPGDSIQVLSPEPMIDGPLPSGMQGIIHDPTDRAQLAYLANTAGGRRVYLNRQLTDADFVLPIGRLGFDPVLGYRGPWSLIFPDLSDEETRRAYRSWLPGDEAGEPPALVESSAVSWLLGTQLQLGLISGATGLDRVIAGTLAEVRSRGAAELDASWTYRADRRAAVVVAGIGTSDRPSSLDDLTLGLAHAARLVRRGGKIVALTRAGGPLGPALGRLASADDPRTAHAALKGAEGEPDYPAARRLADALAWADVYLASDLDENQVEDLGMVALGKPSEARRLAAAADSCLIINQADLTRVELSDDDG